MSNGQLYRIHQSGVFPETACAESLPGSERVKLVRAWILVEATRWYNGWPCVRILFGAEDGVSYPPVEEDCWLAGSLEWRDGEIRERLNKPLLTPLQEAVWDAVVGWAKNHLKESNAHR
ncbi:hypothetical protein MOTE_10340 [Moorella thermoacetica]|uniref:Uncharacterized protein n=1 Tax=Neomoorella thermoacetica TaxID=1525 RepID=A0A1J5NLX1_NEOTH|nr:hypothetical protein MOTE_10340 [Moorella thermoacetica]